MIFFLWIKNTVSFSRYQDFCFFVKPTDFKICNVIISIAAQCKLDLCFFLLNPKSYQILVCCMTNISNMFLAEWWRLETSSRPFYDFIKMTIQHDLAIFNGWHIPFLIVLYLPFQKKMKHWNLDIFGYQVIGAGC